MPVYAALCQPTPVPERQLLLLLLPMLQGASSFRLQSWENSVQFLVCLISIVLNSYSAELTAGSMAMLSDWDFLRPSTVHGTTTKPDEGCMNEDVHGTLLNTPRVQNGR